MTNDNDQTIDEVRAADDVQLDLALSEHAERIREKWHGTWRSIIDTGKALQQARDELRGNWLKMFNNNATKLPFSSDTAARLMKIARHPVLSDPAHGPDLPPSWRTLYELTKIPVPQLLKLRRDSRINAETTRKEAEEAADRIKEEWEDFTDRLKDALDMLLKAMTDWPDPAGLWGGETPPLNVEELGKLPAWLVDLACTRFRRHRVRCFHGIGGASWRGGSSHESSSLRRYA